MALTARDVMFVLRAQNFASREVQSLGRAFGVFGKQLRAVDDVMSKKLNVSQDRMNQQIKASEAAYRSSVRPLQQGNEALRLRNKVIGESLAKSALQSTQHDAIIRARQAEINQNNRAIAQARESIKVQEKNIRTGRDAATGRFANVQAARQEIRAQQDLIAENQRSNAAIRANITEANRANATRQQTAALLRAESAENARKVTQQQNAMNASRRLHEDNTRAAREAHAQRAAIAKADAEQDRRQIAMAQQRVQSLLAIGAAMTMIGGLAATFGVKITSAFSSATVGAAEFQKGLALARVQSDGVVQSTDALREVARRVALEVPAPYREMDRILFTIFTSMNANIEEAEKLLKGFATEAVASNSDMYAAARSTIAIMNALQLSTEHLDRVQDVQFQTVRKGVITYEELSNSLGRALPATRRAGQEIETLGAMLAFLTRNGLNARMAATSAARALEAFAHPRTVGRLADIGVEIKNQDGSFRDLNDVIQDIARALNNNVGALDAMFAIDPREARTFLVEAEENLRSIGVQVRDGAVGFRDIDDVLKDVDRTLSTMSAPARAEALQELFKGAGGTIQARRFWDVAIANAREFNRHIEWQLNSKGAMKEAYDVMFAEPAVMIDYLRNRMEVLSDEIGQELLPVLRTLVVGAIALVDWFRSLDDSTRGVITQSTALVGAMSAIGGMVLVLVGMFTMLVGMVNLAGWQMSKFIGVVSGLTFGMSALALAAVLIITHFDEVSKFLGWLSDALSGTSGIIVGVTVVLGILTAKLAANAAAAGITSGAVSRLGNAYVIASTKISGAAKSTLASMKSFIVKHPVLLGIIAVLAVLAGAYLLVTRRQRNVEASTAEYSAALEAQGSMALGTITSLDQYVESMRKAEQAVLRNKIAQGDLIDDMEKYGIVTKDVIDGITGDLQQRQQLISSLKEEVEALKDASKERSIYTGSIGYSVDARWEELRAQERILEGAEDEVAAIEAVRKEKNRELEAHGELGIALARYMRLRDVYVNGEERRLEVEREVISSLIEHAGGWEDLSPALQEAISELGEFGDVSEDTNTHLRELTNTAKGLQSVIGELLSPTNAWTQALSELNEGLDEPKDSLIEFGEAGKEGMQAWIGALQEGEKTTQDMFANIATVIHKGATEIGVDTSLAIEAILAMGAAGPDAMAMLAEADPEEFIEVLRLIERQAILTSDAVVEHMGDMIEGMDDAWRENKDILPETMLMLMEAAGKVIEDMGPEFEGNAGELIERAARAIGDREDLTREQAGILMEALVDVMETGGTEATRQFIKALTDGDDDLDTVFALYKFNMVKSGIGLAGVMHTSGGKSAASFLSNLRDEFIDKLPNIFKILLRVLSSRIKILNAALPAIKLRTSGGSTSPSRPNTRGGNLGGLATASGIRRQTGGFIPGGGPDRDSILAFLTTGEYVLRRRAVRSIGMPALNVLNSTGSLVKALETTRNRMTAPTAAEGMNRGGVAGGGNNVLGSLDRRLDDLIRLLRDREPVIMHVSTRDDPHDIARRSSAAIRARMG